MKSLLESTVKKLIHGSAALLPAIVQVEFFKALSRELDVSAVVVEGNNGNFEGSADDYLMGSYIKQKEWASALLNLITTRIFAGGNGTYLDIGANIGLTTVPIARAGDIAVHCFEPEPGNWRFLRRNIEMNARDKNITPHNCALFSKNCDLEFEISPDNKGDHRVRGQDPMVQSQLGEAERKTISVEAKTLDSILSAEDLRRPIVAKVDVQGCEVDVFRGGRGFFSEADYVILEFWPYGLLRMGSEVSEFYEIMNEFSYGAILSFDGESAPKLLPVQALIDAIDLDRNFVKGKITAKHHDILLSRTAGFPT